MLEKKCLSVAPSSQSAPRSLHQLQVPETTVLGPFAETSGTVVGKIIDQ